VCRAILIALMAMGTLFASEHRGQVKFGGLPVPGATVTATQGDKRLTAVTDLDGAYSFADLPDGQWTIRVEMQCFSPIERDVAVTPAAPSPVWELKLLPFEQIKASAPPSGGATPVTKPETPAATAAAAASAPVAAAAAAPVSAPAPSGKAPKKSKKTDTAADAAASGGQSGFQRADLNASADGSRLTDSSNPAPAEMNQAPSDGFLVNGSVNNGAASNFAQSAAFGNNRRAGSSLYNGNFGVTMDNSYLDARSFSLTGQDTLKPVYNHLTAMGSFGGPLQLGHLWHQSPPNFVINYQWMRNRNASTQSALVPDAAERAGDLSQLSTAIDPTNGAAFPGNQIPQDRISPQAIALLHFYPLPNFTGTSYNYQVPAVGVTTQNSLQARLNKTIGSKDQMFGSFAWQDTLTGNSNPNVFDFLDTSEMSGLNANVNWSHRIGQRMFTRLSFNFNRSATRLTPYFANLENVSGEAGITGNNQDPLNWGPPSLGFASGIASLSDAQESFNRFQTSSVGFNLYWNHHSHNITYGGDFRRLDFNMLSQLNPRGSFNFTGAATEATANGAAVAGTGSDFADFLLGIPDTSSIAFGNADKYFRTSWYDAYFTDDWRISSSLTVNAGLRWEYSSPIVEKYGRLVNLDIAPGFSAVAPVVAATPDGSLTGRQYPDSLINPDITGFQPRVGLAWRPLPASSLVIRAGYGITYNTSVYTTIGVLMSQQSPLSKSLSVANSPADPLTLASGFNAAPGVTNTFAIDPNFRVGYSQNWNAIMQRDLPGSMVLTLTYLGIKGTRQPQEFLPNTYPAGAVNPCPSCPAGFEYMTSNGDSTRESGQVQLRRRLHSGFMATLQYTYAKAIDDAALGGRGQSVPLVAQNWLDLAGERGLSSFDQRHLVNLQLQYTSGMGVHGGTLLSGWRGTLIKGWTFTGNITAGSGLPLTPVYVSAVTGTGVTGSIRPEYTGQPLYEAPAGLSLNPAAYAIPPAGEWGNAGRDSITGPARFSLDSSMARTFRMSDRLSADLRFDSTNTLNHVTFTSWNTTLGNAQFGLPTGANAMRDMKATFRVRF
jgi:hypothetical protein